MTARDPARELASFICMRYVYMRAEKIVLDLFVFCNDRATAHRSCLQPSWLARAGSLRPRSRGHRCAYSCVAGAPSPRDVHHECPVHAGMAHAFRERKEQHASEIDLEAP